MIVQVPCPLLLDKMHARLGGDLGVLKRLGKEGVKQVGTFLHWEGCLFVCYCAEMGGYGLLTDEECREMAKEILLGGKQ